MTTTRSLAVTALVLIASAAIARANDDTVAVRHIPIKGLAHDAYMRIIGILARRNFVIVEAWPEISAVTAETTEGYSTSTYHNAFTVTVADGVAHITMRKYALMSGILKLGEVSPDVFEPILAEIEDRPANPLGDR